MRSKLFAVLFALYASVASAQSTLPLWDPTTLTQLAPIHYDWNDGQGGDVSYGNLGFGIAPDGNLMVSCVYDSSGFAKINAQTGQIMAPCVGPTMTDLRKLHSDPNATTPKVGGILYHNNRVIVSGFITYDTSGTLATHFAGPSLTQLSGPWAPNVPMGFVKAGMGLVPQAFRQALGGPAFATTGYTSIISRASTSPTLVVFDPDQVIGPNFPMTVLMACGDNDPGCRTYGSPASEIGYSGGELGAIGFFVPQTRTFAVPIREAYGPTCYGYATRTLADHGKPHADAVWCYSLSDPLDTKGPKGYPYGNVFYLYDVNRFVEVKQGTRQPWDVKPYAVVKFPDAQVDDFITSTTFDPAKGILYVAKQIGGGTNTIHRYGGFPTETNVPPPPPTEVCGDGVDNDGDGQIDEGCPPPPPSPVNLTIITAVKTCRVTVQNSPPDANGGWGVQFKWDTNNFGSRDSTPPYERARDFNAGTYQLWGEWTKTGQPSVLIPTVNFTCQ